MCNTNAVTIANFSITITITAEQYLSRTVSCKKILKFGGRYRNQVPSDLGACPGIYRKSIALDQLGKIPRSELKSHTGVRWDYINKKKFRLFSLILLGIGRKNDFFKKGIS